MSANFEIGNNAFGCFPMDFFGVLYKWRNYVNRNGNARSNMIKINNIVNQLSIKCYIECGCLTGFSKLYSRLKRSSTRLAIIHLKTCQQIHRIFRLTNEKRITKW
jgi:hypothetical protein